jgi:acetyl-CoA carboxylase, biotin carboxylase subunit
MRITQADVRRQGHAIEVRINAEDPARNFMPAPGTVSALRVPGGNGVRFDTLLYAGYTIPPFYDSLLGKLIVWDETRPAAIARLKRALMELEIVGVHTTKALHQALASDAAVISARFDTRWLERWLEQNGSRLAEAGTEQAREVAAT